MQAISPSSSWIRTGDRKSNRFMQALVSALALALIAVAPATGQPATGQVIITSKPSMEPLRPPITRPLIMTRPVFEILSWFDRTEPSGSPPASPRGTVVLARDLTLQNLSYKLDTPQLVLVADKLRIGPNAGFDVTGQRRRPGGKIVIIAREITCESGGGLQLVSKGGPGAAGGSIVVVAGSTEPSGASGAMPACVTGVVDGGPALEVRDHRRDPPVVTTIPPGTAGSVAASPLRTAIQADAFAQTAWSMWAIEWLDSLQLGIYDASRRNDYSRVLTLLREYAGFDAPAELVEPSSRASYIALLDHLNMYRKTALPALSVEERTILPGGLPQTVAVFTEGATLRTLLAPTHALASRKTVGGRSVLGLIEYRNQNPNELTIEVEWELTVDPWVERLASEQLTKSGQRLDGVFAGWSLEPKPMQELAMRSAAATLLPGGRQLRVSFVVDADRANLVFWRLLNSAGMPWSVDWTFTERETGRVVKGTWAGPPLSLVRQREPLVAVSNGSLVNNGPSPMGVTYVRDKDGSFVALNPTLRIGPRETVPLPAGAALAVSVPPEAIETSFDPEHFDSHFYVKNAEPLVDHVVIKNNLPTSETGYDAFDYLEVTVRAVVEGNTSLAPAVWPGVRLLARGTAEGEKALPFLRLTQGARRITIEGRAYYTNGERTLKPTTFDTMSVTITRDMFRE